MDHVIHKPLLKRRDNWLHVFFIIAIFLLVIFFLYMAILGGFYPVKQFQYFSVPISIALGLAFITWSYIRLHRLNRLGLLGGSLGKILLYPIFFAITAFLSYLVLFVGVPASINLAIGEKMQMIVTVSSKKDG